MQNKQQKIDFESKKVEEELSLYEKMYNDLNKDIDNSSFSQTIHNSNDYLKVLLKLNSKMIQKSITNKIITNFAKDYTIPY